MFLSNTARYFVICSLFLAGGAGCGYLQSGTAVNLSSAVDDGREPVPFATKEPDVYQAEFVITSGGTERRIFTARKNGRSRIDLDRGTPAQRAIIHSDADIVYSERLKIYAVAAQNTTGGMSELQSDVTTGLLSRRPFTTYESLGRDGGVSKYLARTGESGRSVAVISIDDAGLPVGQEYFSVGGDGTRTLQYKIELRDVRLDADDALFVVPAGTRRVSPAEFRQATAQK